MKVSRKLWLGLLGGVAAVSLASAPASAQQQQEAFLFEIKRVF
jgi:hypothetical protein